MSERLRVYFYVSRNGVYEHQPVRVENVYSYFQLTSVIDKFLRDMKGADFFMELEVLDASDF